MSGIEKIMHHDLAKRRKGYPKTAGDLPQLFEQSAVALVCITIHLDRVSKVRQCVNIQVVGEQRQRGVGPVARRRRSPGPGRPRPRAALAATMASVSPQSRRPAGCPPGSTLAALPKGPQETTLRAPGGRSA